jgi:hypothetical protein
MPEMRAELAKQDGKTQVRITGTITVSDIKSQYAKLPGVGKALAALRPQNPRTHEFITVDELIPPGAQQTPCIMVALPSLRRKVYLPEELSENEQYLADIVGADVTAMGEQEIVIFALRRYIPSEK